VTFGVLKMDLMIKFFIIVHPNKNYNLVLGFNGYTSNSTPLQM